MNNQSVQYMVSWAMRFEGACGNKTGTLEEITAYINHWKHVWKSYSVFIIGAEISQGVYDLVPIIL